MPEFTISLLKTISVALATLALGCGGQSERQPVFGNVSGADGRPGVISFVPVSGNHSPAARCRILDDHYQFSVEDGPLPGRYEVLIQLEQKGAATGQVIRKEVAIPVEAAGEMPAEFETMPPFSATVPAVHDSRNLQLDFQVRPQSPLATQ